MANREIESIIYQLSDYEMRVEGLENLKDCIKRDSYISFIGQMKDLFGAVRQCLRDDRMEIILQVTQLLTDMTHDIATSGGDDLEIHLAQMVPCLIENLGNSKAVVRKSTHKCIASYVKVSKRLEQYGLNSAQTRTRQHSMLVVPALLSLKPAIVNQGSDEMIKLMQTVGEKLEDQAEIVQRTAKKLIWELKKNYGIPIQKIIDEIPDQNIKQDATEIYSEGADTAGSTSGVESQSIRSGNERSLTHQSSIRTDDSRMNERSSASGVNASRGNIDDIIQQAKSASSYPMGPNGLVFGIVSQSLIDNMSSSNAKLKQNSLKQIEDSLPEDFSTSFEFLPYTTPFMKFLGSILTDLSISKPVLSIINRLFQTQNLNMHNSLAFILPQIISLLKSNDQKNDIFKTLNSLVQNNYPPKNFIAMIIKYLGDRTSTTLISNVLELICMATLNINPGKAPIVTEWPSDHEILESICSCFASATDSIRGLALETLSLILTGNEAKKLSTNHQQMMCDQLQRIITQEQFLMVKERLGQGNNAYLGSNFIPVFPMRGGKPKNLRIEKPQSNFNNNTTGPQTDVSKSINNSVTPSQSQGGYYQNFYNRQSFDQDSQASKRSIDESKKSSSISVSNQPPPRTKNPSKSQPYGVVDSSLGKEEDQKINMWLPSFANQNPPGKKQSPRDGQRHTLSSGEGRGGYAQEELQSPHPQPRGQASAQSHLQSSISKSMNKQTDYTPELRQAKPRNLHNQSSQNNEPTGSANSQSTRGDSSRQTTTQISQQQEKSQVQDKLRLLKSNSRKMHGSAQPSSKSPPHYDTPIPQSNNIQSFEDPSLRQSLSSNKIQSTPSYTKPKIGGTGSGGGAGSHTQGIRTLDQPSKQQMKTTDASRNRDPKGTFSNNQESSYDQALNIGIPQNKKHLYYSPAKPLNQAASSNIPASTTQASNNQQTSFSEQDKNNTGAMSQVLNTYKRNAPVKAISKPRNKTINVQDDEINKTKESSPYYEEEEKASPMPYYKSQKQPSTVTTGFTPQSNKKKGSSIRSGIAGSAQKAGSADNTQTSGFTQSRAPPPKINNADIEMRKVQEDIKDSSNWQKQFDACNKIKGFSVDYPQYLQFGGAQKETLQELIKLTDSLRSQLARNALQAFCDLFTNLKNKMDNTLDSVIPALIKKSADTNQFIAQEAEQALQLACENCTESKILNATNNLGNVRSNGLKEKLGLCIAFLCEKLGRKITSFSGADKIFAIISNQMNEGSQEVRNQAKIAIITIYQAIGSKQETEKLLMRNLNDSNFKKAITFIERDGGMDVRGLRSASKEPKMRSTAATKMGAASGTNSLAGTNNYSNQSEVGAQDGRYSTGISFNSTNFTAFKKGGPSTGGQGTGGQQRNNLAKPPLDQTVIEEYQQYLNEFRSSDWKIRTNAIESITDFICSNQQVIHQNSKKFVGIMDIFCNGISDNNSKVVTCAYDCFKSVLQMIAALLQDSVPQLVTSLAQGLSASNVTTRSSADDIINAILKKDLVDKSTLLQPFIAQINAGNQRNKPLLMKSLGSFVGDLYEERPAIVNKSLVPQLYKWIDDATIKGEAKTALSYLIKESYSVMGNSLLEGGSQTQAQKMYDVISK